MPTTNVPGWGRAAGDVRASGALLVTRLRTRDAHHSDTGGAAREKMTFCHAVPRRAIWKQMTSASRKTSGTPAGAPYRNVPAKMKVSETEMLAETLGSLT